MTDREILIEILAIKLYEYDYNPDQRRSRDDQHPWNFISDEDRQIYRDVVEKASDASAMYDETGEGGLA